MYGAAYSSLSLYAPLVGTAHPDAQPLARNILQITLTVMTMSKRRERDDASRGDVARSIGFHSLYVSFYIYIYNSKITDYALDPTPFLRASLSPLCSKRP